MAAYVIVDINITDAERYERYKVMAAPTVGQFNGEYVVRGGTAKNLEGDWEPGRVVVLRFPTLARAEEWWASDEYAPAKVLRQEAANSTMIVVEGV